jgi:hypothetical protein
VIFVQIDEEEEKSQSFGLCGESKIMALLCEHLLTRRPQAAAGWCIVTFVKEITPRWHPGTVDRSSTEVQKEE